MNAPKNYRNPQSFRALAKQAQKLSEIAYLEACQSKPLQNRALMEHCFNHAETLTKYLESVGYWKKSIITEG
jgi:hypothetical protein